jgi:N-acetylneuraminic acid mutarotase
MISLVLTLATLMLPTPNAHATAPGDAVVWRNLPDLPQALGGQFVGVIDDHLVVAGGSYFVVPPWNGGKKQWVATIYTLERNALHWQLAGHLPTPLGYGVSITTPHEMLCIGGQTPSGNSRHTLRLRLVGGRIQIVRLADLPETDSNMTGALAGDTVYVAGGQSTPDSTHARHTFWALPLSPPFAHWRTLPAWPGPARIFPVTIASGSTVCVLSGEELTGTLGPPVGRRFLTDGYCYHPGNGWRKLPDLPHPTAGGLGAEAGGELLVFGGNDGSLADREYEIREKHPGFSKAIYGYDPRTEVWRIAGTIPHSLVTTGMVRWGDEWVIAGGEDHPAHRSAQVIAGRILDTDR